MNHPSQPFISTPAPIPLSWCSAADLCRLFGVLKIRTVLDLRTEQEAADDNGDNDIGSFVRHARNETLAADGTEMSVNQMPTVGAVAAASVRASAFAARTEANRTAGVIAPIAENSSSIGTDKDGEADVPPPPPPAADSSGGGADLAGITADEVFDALDLNSSGDITKAEFIKGKCTSSTANIEYHASFLPCGIPEGLTTGRTVMLVVRCRSGVV